MEGASMNPDHFADSQWDEVLERQAESGEPADEQWPIEALYEWYNG